MLLAKYMTIVILKGNKTNMTESFVVIQIDFNTFWIIVGIVLLLPKPAPFLL